MNRKQRRAALKQRPPTAASPDAATAAASATDRLFAEALWHQDHGNLGDAAKAFKRLLSVKPDHALAVNNFGCLLLAQGKPDQAATMFERLLTLAPELLDDFPSIAALLVSVNPAINDASKRAASAWPQRLPARELLGPSGIAAIAADPLLRHVLESTTIRAIGLERLLTSIRLHALQTAGDTGDQVEQDALAFYCALARQCFINEYVFAATPDESEHAAKLKDALVAAIAAGASVAPRQLVTVAMYAPLHSLPNAPALLDRPWPAPVRNVLAQQIGEPLAERDTRNSIPRLTEIANEVSLLVQQQYEENPYPRWVYAAAAPAPVDLDDYLRRQFPASAVRPLGNKSTLEILLAGCGTGRHAIEVAQKYRAAQVLAVDLSLASLCYAKRKTPPALANKIEYAQADILNLATIGRTFDLIEASGVLHHLSDPLAGWRSLLALLRPGGVMHLGLYSEIARRPVVAARGFVADRGYRPTADDLQRCRQDLMNSSLGNELGKLADFYSSSELRDLLFHVQESRLTIPQIKSFLIEQDLKFIGFEFSPQAMRHYSTIFANARWPLQDLDRWHDFEVENPGTFTGMYQFWVQKN
jgi:SAM-dependent methyltransferase